MSAMLVDASVAVKWFITEEHSERSLALFHDAARRDWRFICPPHFTSEVINVVYRRTRRGDDALRLDMQQASRAVDSFLAMEFVPIRSEELYRHAWTMARHYEITTIYDSLYVALADLYETPLWTADLPLLKAAGDASLVRWIGDYQG